MGDHRGRGESGQAAEGAHLQGSLLRDVWLAGALLVCTNGPVVYLAWHVLHGAPHPEDPFLRAAFGWTAATSALVVLLDSQRVSGRRLLRPPRLAALAVVSFTVMIVASSLWSVDPAVTRARSLIYVGLAALGWIAADLEAARLRRAVLCVCVAVLAGSLAAVVVSDAIGRDAEGAWQGLFVMPAELAVPAALALLLVVPNLHRTGAGTLALALILAATAAVVLVGTGSLAVVAALVTAVAGASLLWAASTGRGNLGDRRTWRNVGVAALVALVVLGPLGLAERAWSSSALASRRAVWGPVWEMISERPILGHGWFTVWDTPGLQREESLVGLTSAHNSFLEVWLGAGLSALVAFVAIVGLALWGSARTLWLDPTAESWSWFAVVVFLVAVNLVLSLVLWFSYVWVLLIGAALRRPSLDDSPLSATPADARRHGRLE